MADNEGTPTQTTDTPAVEQVADASATAEATNGGAQTDMSVAELREWLRRWVAEATGQPIEQITVDRPMEEFGLASRDAIALGGDIEELTGVLLNATIVYQHPTIAALAERIINGEPEAPEETEDDSFYTAGYRPGEAHDIAIVGLSTRLPGAGDTPESTWDFLIGRGDGIRELPEGRWSEFMAEPQLAEAIEKANTKGGYLDQEVVKGFDAEFFAMSPVEVERVDPQQRLMMELTWEALEHARIPASELKGEPVGVFIGSSGNDFMLLAALGLGSERDPNVPVSAEAYAIMGSVSSIIPNRVSYFFDFRGPSVSVDTACSSTLVAVHEAVQALRNGDADLALAGGVNMLLAPMATLGFDANGGVAKDGHIKAFSNDADGMVRSEGGGLVVLKRLADAERDGDTIYAVIKGTAVNNDGRSNGLLAPNPDAQAEVLRRAYRDAGIAPSSVDYIEAHGTGTLIGDPIEADALGRVVGRGREADKPALLGSAKTNFGHLESGAGAASLAKVVMSLQHNVIPPNIGFAGPNPYIPWDQARLKVVEEPTEFPRYSGKATIGISGFGFGGTNAHIVVQEYVAAESQAPFSELESQLDEDTVEETTDAAAESEAGDVVAEVAEAVAEWTAERTDPLPQILPVSGYLPSRRRRAAAELADWLESEAGAQTPLADVARSLAKRSHWRSRGVVLAKTHEEAIAGLRAIAAGKPGPGVFTADAPAAMGPMWVLAGFGAQHRKMGKQLYLENSIFAKAVDEVDELVQDEAGYSVRELFLDDSQDYNVGTSQVGIFTIQVGLAALLRAHGAEPEAVVGHSMGEVAGAYIAGGLSLEDAVRVICARSRLMGEGEQMISDDDVRNMALVEYSAEDVANLLPEYPDVEVAVYAAPTNTVIGGPQDQVAAIVARVEAAGKFARVLQTRGAGHTSQMDPLLGELAAELAGIEPTKLKTGLYSTVHKEEFFRAGHDPIHDEDYWVKNMRHSVYFTNAVKLAVDAGHTTFLELAPNSVALMQVLGTTFAAGVHDAQLIPTLKRKEDESAGVIAALAQLYVHGHKVDLFSLVGPGEYADVPRTTFVRKEYWPKVQLSSGGNGRLPGAHVALPDGRHVWEVQASAVTDLAGLVRAAAAQVLSDVSLGASIPHAPIPAAGTLTTTLTPHPGGASVQVHAKEGGAFRLVFDAVVTSGAALPEPVVAEAAVAAQPQSDADLEVVETFGDRWDPNGTQSVEERLALIVAESMGYAVEDLPMEIPLMELGLDSLMAMRIKNRVEYEFDIPQLQVQAVRDASLHEVGKVLRYAIEHRDEVQAMADQQAADKAAGGTGELAVDADFIATARAALATGADPVAAVTGAAPTSSETTASESDSVPASAEDAAGGDATPTPQPVAEAAAVFGAGAKPSSADEDDVPPRDAAERLTFATWAVVTGKSAGGIFNTLPILDEDTAEKLAARLTERVKAEVTVDDVLDCETIEQLADIVRNLQDSGADVDGFVRPLRARAEGSNAVPVFVFHPSGGNTLVYEPLLKRLPADTPMYGMERVEGSIEERARQYLPELRKIQCDGPFVLYGWSLGAVLAMQTAQLLRAEGADVRVVGLIDLAIPTQGEDNSPEERVRRIERYQAFAKKTYGVDGELDREQLETLAAASDEEQFKMISDLIKISGTKIPGGVLEHQRTSWIESRELAKTQPSQYDGNVVLYLADRYHDGMIELEPRFADRLPNGGWNEYIPNLEVVHIAGDHLQIIDEPRIGKIGADLTAKLAAIEAKGAK
ncbi:polyketide synthase Pks13 [Nocardia sp. CDC186]|uniref:Polyketide synthase Pks13 n=1 Tax=Nocardia implantans TaxID=3108168 RepID=A0ABU6ANR5_9NOCA|nr:MULTISPECIES: polyketide synthase Pks13 [unclassified Nocardia]MBF6192176.1 acyltransferase domain-containing protein [Nocardia beijingensis]MEA3530927.1 polyketide synthase Pks13 [Nocardia sp. CDC192]MEB3509017.1 polyketide synthase Pks13 [Nocardia sp. CDC186]